MSYKNKEKPKTPADQQLSARHLRDTIRFNEAHADDHDKEAKEAKKALKALEDRMDDRRDGDRPLSQLGRRTLQGFKKRYGDDGEKKFQKAIKSGTLSSAMLAR